MPPFLDLAAIGNRHRQLLIRTACNYVGLSATVERAQAFNNDFSDRVYPEITYPSELENGDADIYNPTPNPIPSPIACVVIVKDPFSGLITSGDYINTMDKLTNNYILTTLETLYLDDRVTVTFPDSIKTTFRVTEITGGNQFSQFSYTYGAVIY